MQYRVILDGDISRVSSTPAIPKDVVQQIQNSKPFSQKRRYIPSHAQQQLSDGASSRACESPMMHHKLLSLLSAGYQETSIVKGPSILLDRNWDLDYIVQWK